MLLAVGDLRDEAYGLAIHKHLERLTGRSIAIGQIYTSLSRLEQHGYVSTRVAEPTSRRGGRRKKLYRLERSGVEVLRHSHAAYRDLADKLAEALPRLARG